MEPAEDEGKQTENRNIHRVSQVLDALAAAKAGLRLTDIAEQIQLGKSTVHRLLAGLVANRMVELDEETGRYFLGLKLLAWSSAVKNRFAFARLAEPALDRIAQRTHDTVYLVARVGDEIVCLDCREGSYPIKVLTLGVGDRRPLGIGAGSMAILAALPDVELERIMETQASERAPFPFDEPQLRQMIANARRDGYAYNNVHLFHGMEKVPGMAAIAVPLRRPDGWPVAALHVTTITARLEPPRRESVLAILKKEAGLLETQYGSVLDNLGRADPGQRAGGARLMH
jgi:DNA-binding IclR family transcriptional regulator